MSAGEEKGGIWEEDREGRNGRVGNQEVCQTFGGEKLAEKPEYTIRHKPVAGEANE